MWPFKRKPVEYRRSDSLQSAGQARARGDYKKAIAEYRRILEHEPDNTDVHGKLAPLLAEQGEPKEAWASFEKCAEGLRTRGFVDRAISVYLQAAEHLPGWVLAWERAASMHVERQRRAEAIKVLLEGRTFMRAPEFLADARRLLKCVLELEPLHYDARMDLAGEYLREKRSADALAVLEPLVPHQEGAALRRVRARMFAARPSGRHAWLWVRAALLGR